MNVRSFNYEGFESLAVAQPLEAFDAPKAVQVPLAPPAPKPVFTGEEIELAKTLARDEGMREGQEQSKKQFDEERNSIEALEAIAIKRILEEVNTKLAVMQEESQANRNKFSKNLGQLALNIAQKVCGDVSAEIIEKQITAIINESVAQLDSGDKIKLHLNPKNAAHLNDKFTLGEVIGDEKMELGDFRLEWQNGFAERDVKKLWQAIGEICARHSSLEENEPISASALVETIKEGE